MARANIHTLYILSQDLCERREKYVQRKHQKALAKVQTMVSYKGRLESQGKHLVGCTSPHVLYTYGFNYNGSCFPLQSEKDDSRIIRVSDRGLQM